MAKTNIFTLSAAFLLLAATGCKKNAAPAATESSAAGSTAMKPISAHSFTFYEYGEEITEEDFLVNNHDDADQAFNYVNHAMTLGLLDIYEHNPAVMASIVSDINASKNHELNLYDVADNYAALDEAIGNAFNGRYGTRDWRSYVAAHYVYDTPYVPFIGFMNIGEVDATQPAFVSEPLELNEEKFTQFDDDYPMWISLNSPLAAPMPLRFTSVNEEMGYKLKNPIVRIANGFEGDDMEDYMEVPSRFEENGRDISMNTVPQERPSGAGGNGGTIYPGQQPRQYPQKDEWLTHVKFQINERYENWGKSEYQFAWAQAGAYNIANFTWPEYSTHIRSIEKNLEPNQIGTMMPFYFDVFHSGNYASQYNFLKFRVAHMPADKYCFYAVGAFERDWGNKKKHLFTVCTANGTIKGRRKYQNEWYFIDEATNFSYPFSNRNPNYHTSYWNYTKGVLQLHRWNL